jgi:hypothetical protein
LQFPLPDKEISVNYASIYANLVGNKNSPKIPLPQTNNSPFKLIAAE